MKCANCSAGAVFTVTNPASRPVHYCNSCIPKHLRDRANAGHFPLQAPLQESASSEQVANPKRSKKKVDPVDEPVAEVVEEVAAEVSEEPSSEDL